jgi:hypothetical protein
MDALDVLSTLLICVCILFCSVIVLSFLCGLIMGIPFFIRYHHGISSDNLSESIKAIINTDSSIGCIIASSCEIGSYFTSNILYGLYKVFKNK